MVLSVKVYDLEGKQEPRTFEYSSDVFACDYMENVSGEINCTIFRREQATYTLIELQKYLNTLSMRFVKMEVFLDDILIAVLDNIIMINYNLSNRPIGLNDTLRDEVFELLRIKTFVPNTNMDAIKVKLEDAKAFMNAEFERGKLREYAKELYPLVVSINTLLNVKDPATLPSNPKTEPEFEEEPEIEVEVNEPMVETETETKVDQSIVESEE